MIARTIVSACTAAILGLFFMAADAAAFPVYADPNSNDDCEFCHGGFLDRPYTSDIDGQWLTATGGFLSLHDGHRNFMLNRDCNTCHQSSGRTPVRLNRSVGGAGWSPPDDNVSCIGCHGRKEDRGTVDDCADPFLADPNEPCGDGAGLRQHHFVRGETICAGCHLDADPAFYIPAGEHVNPFYYVNPDPDTVHTAKPTDACNPAGEEDYAASPLGLDNDGDGLYDLDDPDCAPPGVEDCFDGIDNDGDMLVDCADSDCDGAVNGPCDTGLPGICAAGSRVCTGGVEECAMAQQPEQEICDDGLDNDCDGLVDGEDSDCQVAVCGDGAVDPGEDCDDGNTAPGDCCAADCTFEVAGSPCLDQADTECDHPDTCNGAGACLPNFEPAGVACGDQGIECLVDDSCNGSGQCADGGFQPDGMPCGDPSNTQCDNPDTCAGGTCVANNEPAGSPCDDALFCTVGETCDGSSVCTGGAANPCDDGVACTDDSCDEINDLCVNAANDANCPDDGLFCNGPEFCDPALDCSSTGDPCPAGQACDETNDRCGECTTDADCDDALFCNGAETCVAGTCQPGTAPDCDDGVACTADSCNESTDACDHAADDTLCDNGQFCDGTETCDATLGCQPGTAPDCGDGVGCTDDSCDEVNDVCVNVANDANCPDDGLFCNGAEFCDPALDCSSTGDPCPAGTTCNDSSDACDPVGCTTDADCDDGAFCNGAESCDVGSGLCQAGTPVSCDDGVGCTVDSCNEGTDACDNVPDDALCGSGQFCDPQLDCQPVPVEDCFDGMDNDGDGRADCADADCDGVVRGDCDTGQPGICRDGTAICQGGAEVCVQDAPAEPEGPVGMATCSDGLDNDCDGLVDGQDPDCQAGEQADVFLKRLKARSSMHMRVGETDDRKVKVTGDGDTRMQDATVTLSVAAIPQVGVVITPASVTKQVGPDEDLTHFRFETSITCLEEGRWTLMWTASISAPENRDPTNDTRTDRTVVFCRSDKRDDRHDDGDEPDDDDEHDHHDDPDGHDWKRD